MKGQRGMLFCFYSWSIKVIIVSKSFFIKFNIAKFVTFIPYRSQPNFPRKLRQMNTIRWYKIGKLLLHTQKEKHSNGLEDRPSFCQVDKGALQKNQNNCVTFFTKQIYTSTKVLVEHN